MGIKNMKRLVILMIFFLIINVIANAGCIDNTKANNTWGEKKISLEKIKVSDNTAGNRSEQNDSIYYVSGYITNDNPFEALDFKLKVTTYYSNGTIFAVNETPYIDPKNIPGQGKSYFYARFSDPDKKITRFEVKIVGAKGELV
jgi:capsule polysaccharide export protein KpsE/RkpR